MGSHTSKAGPQATILINKSLETVTHIGFNNEQSDRPAVAIDCRIAASNEIASPLVFFASHARVIHQSGVESMWPIRPSVPNFQPPVRIFQWNQRMKTLCKLKKSKLKCKKRNFEKFAEIATHQCSKCDRFACSKKALCKAKKLTTSH